MENDVLIFFSFIVLGLFIGIVFDILRVIRKNIFTHYIFVCLEDIIFCLFSGIVILLMCYYTNFGQLRGYMFVGFIIGILLYLLIFSKFIFKIIDFFLSLVIKLFTSVWKVVFNYGKKFKKGT